MPAADDASPCAIPRVPARATFSAPSRRSARSRRHRAPSRLLQSWRRQRTTRGVPLSWDQGPILRRTVAPISTEPELVEGPAPPQGEAAPRGKPASASSRSSCGPVRVVLFVHLSHCSVSLRRPTICATLPDGALAAAPDRTMGRTHGCTEWKPSQRPWW